MDKLSAFGERLKVGGAEVGRRVSEVSDRMKDMLQSQISNNGAVDRLVEEATGSHGFEVDWGRFMAICDMVNDEEITGQDLARSLRRRMSSSAKDPRCHTLLLLLLEAVVKNCDRMFSEVASEKVLDEMVKLVNDPVTSTEARDKALRLIQAWGEATDELRYLPAFEDTYKSLISKGVKFPERDAESMAPLFTPPQSVDIESSSIRTGVSRLTMRDVVAARPPTEDSDEQAKQVVEVARNSNELLSTVLSSAPAQEVVKDDLVVTLVEQCRQSQFNLQRVIRAAVENEALLSESLMINDEVEKTLAKYEEMCKAASKDELPTSQEPFVIVDEQEASEVKEGPADPLANLDKMIFGDK